MKKELSLIELACLLLKLLVLELLLILAFDLELLLKEIASMLMIQTLHLPL